jgi:hypothetical protein
MGKPERPEELFAGRHFDREIILLCVRRYLRFKLSLRDLVEMMAERGLSLAHTTITRWVQHYTPEFEKPLASSCPCRRPFMARRRDIRPDQRRMALSISCRGPGGSDG